MPLDAAGTDRCGSFVVASISTMASKGERTLPVALPSSSGLRTTHNRKVTISLRRGPERIQRQPTLLSHTERSVWRKETSHTHDYSGACCREERKPQLMLTILS